MAARARRNAGKRTISGFSNVSWPIVANDVNLDAASEEFDSLDLGIEKDVTPKGRVSFVVGPLTPGVYSFIGELHADTAHGAIKAIAAH